MSKPQDINLAKEAAAKAALQYVEEGMKIGLGTGSTAAYFIQHLGNLCRKGLRIETVATSEASHRLAQEQGISLIDINKIDSLDIAVDGADEVDDKKQLIKGGGGAAFREKIVAKMSKKFIVIVDEKKRVEYLGKFPLAVEILPFAWMATKQRLIDKGFKGKMRQNKDGKLYMTDNGNYIFDIALAFPCKTPQKTENAIRDVTGVIETGFFIDPPWKVIVGFVDGHVEIID